MFHLKLYVFSSRLHEQSRGSLAARPAQSRREFRIYVLYTKLGLVRSYTTKEATEVWMPSRLAVSFWD